MTSIALTIGCGGKPSTESANAAANNSVDPTVLADGTTLMVVESPSGIKSEVKTYPTGAVIQLTRVTRPDGRRDATVKMRNGYTVDLQDRDDIDRAIEMSSEGLVAAVKKIPGAAEYATAPASTPTVTTPQETKPEVKKEEKPVPMKVINEGKPSKPTDKPKPASTKKRQ